MGMIIPDELHVALRERHRKERDGRVKDRIKAVLLRDKGYSYEEIAEVLFLSDEGARQHVADYLRAQKLAPENGGSEPNLNAEQTAKLLAHLQERTYLYVHEIVAYVLATFGVTYTMHSTTSYGYAVNLNRGDAACANRLRVPRRVVEEVLLAPYRKNCSRLTL